MRLKRFCATALGIVLLLCSISSFAQDAAIIETFDAKNVHAQKTQGADNFYYCEFVGDDYKHLVFNSSNNRWVPESGEGYPFITPSLMLPHNTDDGGFVFVAPRKGVISIGGDAKVTDSCKEGDGVTFSVSKNGVVLWSGAANPTNKIAPKADVKVSVRAGDEIHFRCNAGKHNAYDYTVWMPTVSYVDSPYVPEPSKYKYFEFDGENRRELSYNEDEVYIASDGVAHISYERVMPTAKYSLIQQYTAESYGNYRVTATLSNDNILGGGILVTLMKNNEPVWKQLCPESEKSNIDVRMLLEKDDVIDVVVGVARYEGYNLSEWSCEIEKTFHDPICNASTSVGGSVYEEESFTLGSLVTQTPQNTRIYSLWYDTPRDMKWDATAKRWNSTISGDGGYISETTVHPGTKSDSVIEYTVQKDGLIKIDGSVGVRTDSDGVLTKVYLNGNEIWSNRVGGERSVKWDEEFGTSYFINETGVYAEVKAGDILTFSFGRWKIIQVDETDISQIKIAYVDDKVISKTTAWKLENSSVIDTTYKTVRIGDEVKAADVLINNGTTYATADTLKLFGVSEFGDTAVVLNDKEYYPLRKAVEASGNNVTWAADRYVIVYDGIPVRFGWQELSEIAISVKRGGGKLEY